MGNAVGGHGFGTHGVWTHYENLTPPQAARVEQLGYGTVWLGGSAQTLEPARAILAATDGIRVATGITNIWNTDAAVIANEFADLERDFPGRFVLGVGAGHKENDSDYRKPYDAVVDYLDVLDAHDVPRERRVLAALGPKMLRLAGERALGAHPYLTTPEHTASARKIIGAHVFLAPEQKIVLEADAVTAREIGRPRVKPYLGLRNYVANLERSGFTDEDLAGSGSDRLIDALAVHGDADAVRRQVDEHLAAGADHVAIQVLGADDITDVLERMPAG